jgi:CRP/FNR family transcriptional regulator
VRDRIGAQAHVMTLPANTRICEGICDGSHVVILRGGFIRIVHHTQTGRRQIIGIVRPGQSVGWEPESDQHHDVEAITPVSLCRFDRSSFERLIRQEPELRHALGSQLLRRLDETRQLTWLLVGLGASARLRTLLLISRYWMGWKPEPDGTGILTMALPRRDIADLLATTPETVSRLLRQFNDEGLIEILSPSKFRLRDICGLSEGLEKPSLV